MVPTNKTMVPWYLRTYHKEKRDATQKAAKNTNIAGTAQTG
jgi:hypothetical protein